MPEPRETDLLPHEMKMLFAQAVALEALAANIAAKASMLDTMPLSKAEPFIGYLEKARQDIEVALGVFVVNDSVAEDAAYRRPEKGQSTYRLPHADTLPPPRLAENEEPVVATIIEDTVLEVGDQQFRLACDAVELFTILLHLRDNRAIRRSDVFAEGFRKELQGDPARDFAFTRAKRRLLTLNHNGLLLFRVEGQSPKASYSVLPQLEVREGRASFWTEDERALTHALYGRLIPAQLEGGGSGAGLRVMLLDHQTVQGDLGWAKLSEPERFLLNFFIVQNGQFAKTSLLTALGFESASAGNVAQKSKFRRTFLGLLEKLHTATGLTPRELVQRKYGEGLRLKVWFIDSPQRILAAQDSNTAQKLKNKLEELGKGA